MMKPILHLRREHRPRITSVQMKKQDGKNRGGTHGKQSPPGTDNSFWRVYWRKSSETQTLCWKGSSSDDEELQSLRCTQARLGAAWHRQKHSNVILGYLCRAVTQGRSQAKCSSPFISWIPPNSPTWQAPPSPQFYNREVLKGY